MSNSTRIKKMRRAAHHHVCPSCKDDITGRPTIWLHNPYKAGCSSGMMKECVKCDPNALNEPVPERKVDLPLPVRTMVVIKITDMGKLGLASQAVEHGYVKSTGMLRLHGLGRYIEEHASMQTYVDNRPDYMKQMDYLPIFSHRKMWMPEGDVRRMCSFSISSACIERLITIGEYHGVDNMRLERKTGKINIVGLVIEAIGREWLVES